MPSKRLAYRNLPHLFLKAREELLCHFRPIITHFGLTEQQWRILRTLDEKEQLEPREICELCHILSPSLTGVLARMETIGLVTRLMKDDSTDEELAVVYVPTSPKPTSGYIEIVPVDKLTFTDWTFDQAMSFVITGGSNAPDRIAYHRKPAEK